jgi:hypothetical protein
MVLPFEGPAIDAPSAYAGASLGEVVHRQILMALANRSELAVVAPLSGPGPQQNDLHEIGEWGDADIVVQGSFNPLGDMIEIRGQSTRVESDEPGQAFSVSGAIDEAPGPINLVVQRVVELLLGASEETGSLLLPDPTTDEARQAYIDGLESYLTGRHSQALTYFHRAHQLDTTFLAPLIASMEANSELGRWTQVDSLISIVAPRMGDLSGLDRLRFEEFATRGGSPIG